MERRGSDGGERVMEGEGGMEGGGRGMDGRAGGGTD